MVNDPLIEATTLHCLKAFAFETVLRIVNLEKRKMKNKIAPSLSRRFRLLCRWLAQSWREKVYCLFIRNHYLWHLGRLFAGVGARPTGFRRGHEKHTRRSARVRH